MKKTRKTLDDALATLPSINHSPPQKSSLDFLDEKKLSELISQGRVIEDFDTSIITSSPMNKRLRISLAPDDAELEKLVASIASIGQHTPAFLKKGEGGKLVLLTGNRRLEACRLLNKPLKGILLSTNDELLETALIFSENKDRLNNSPYESAIQIKTMIEAGHSQVNISKITGESKAYISMKALIADIPEQLIDLLTDPRKVSVDHLYKIAKTIKEQRLSQEEVAIKASQIAEIVTNFPPDRQYIPILDALVKKKRTQPPLLKKEVILSSGEKWVVTQRKKGVVEVSAPSLCMEELVAIISDL